jgi:hypothetical protein
MGHALSRRKRGAALVLLASALVGLTGCGDEASEGEGRTSLTIYSSFPFQGAPRSISTSTANGIRVALRAGNRIRDGQLSFNRTIEAPAQ